MISRLALAAALSGLFLHAANAAPVGAPTQPPARASLVRPLVVTKLQDLSFGTIIPRGTHLGIVDIDSDTGARSANGGVTLIASDPGQRAYFEIAGTPGHRVGIDLIWPPELISENGDSIDLVSLDLEGAIFRNLHGVTGLSNFGVGGKIELEPDQAEGLYSATFDVIVWYN